MATYVRFDREQPFLLPPDLKDWLPEDDIAHFIVAAVERVRLGAFRTTPQAGGKPQYHPRLMLALLLYSYANGVFSSRRIERATYRENVTAEWLLAALAYNCRRLHNMRSAWAAPANARLLSPITDTNPTGC